MEQIIYRKILPVAIGALLGFAYYYFIGCNSGSCAITSNPYISTIYGGVIGLLLVFPIKKKKNETVNNGSEKERD